MYWRLTIRINEDGSMAWGCVLQDDLSNQKAISIVDALAIYCFENMSFYLFPFL